jgi:DNA-binding XRE family transcriptional regulator
MTLKQARVLAGYTQADAAKALDVTPSAISAWEAGKAEPRAKTFMQACSLYNVRPEDIFLELEYEKVKMAVKK